MSIEKGTVLYYNEYGNFEYLRRNPDAFKAVISEVVDDNSFHATYKNHTETFSVDDIGKKLFFNSEDACINKYDLATMELYKDYFNNCNSKENRCHTITEQLNSNDRNINKFIGGVLNYIFTEFREHVESSENLCHLNNLYTSYNIVPNYENEAVQQLYLLRYFMAYFCEYLSAYITVMGRKAMLNLKEINVLSLGCGAYIDYYGLHYAKVNNVKLNYFGVDKVDWKYKFVSNMDNCSYYNEDITKANMNIDKEINIIVFPKSIGEIKLDGMQNLLSILENVKINSNLYILNFVCDYGDTLIFNEFIENFCQGFDYECKTNEYFKTPESDSCKSFSEYNVFYPTNINRYLTDLKQKCKMIGTKDDCLECFNKPSPVMTKKYVKYQIAELKKLNN